MFTEEDMTYVREQFERDGMEALIDLVETPIYRVLCIRIFLLHRNQWLEEINAWATKVANNCDLFLPGDISRNDNPLLFQDIRDFESKYNNEINAEIHNHPMQFSKSEIASCGIQESINIWKADKKNKKALDIGYSDELQLVIEKLFDILKEPFRKHGINISSSSDCDFIRM